MIAIINQFEMFF